MSDLYPAAREICVKFAERNNLTFSENGSVGFMRPCVGFMRGNRYIDYNPYDWQGDDIKRIPETESPLSNPPSKLVPDAYHKHDCMAVLVQEDDVRGAVVQLAEWVRHLERGGDVKIVPFRAPLDAASFFDRTDRIAHAIVVVPRSTPHERKPEDGPDATAERFAAMELE